MMKEKKLILIALTINHHSLYLSLIKFLIKSHYNITVLTREENSGFFNDADLTDGISFIFDSGETSAILGINKRFIETFDVLLIDEFYGKYYNLYKINFNNKKKVCIIHNTNKWVLNRQRFSFKHSLIYYLKNQYFQQFDAYITMGPNVKSYLEEFTDKEVFFFPFDEYSNGGSSKEIESREKIDIVIPGKISSDRRNYSELINVLENYYSRNPESVIRVKLLGKLEESKSNEYVKIKIDELNRKYGKKLFYWSSFIPVKEFEQEIVHADVIMSNLNVVNRLNDRVEIYGLTKESGISFVIYKYAKVAIVPDLQKVLSGFSDQLIHYTSYEQLINIFTQIEKGTINIDQLRKHAIENSRTFRERANKEKNRIEKYLN